VVKEWAAKSPFPLNLQSEPRKGLAMARNCGLRAARGSLLVWTDDDCRLNPDYIAKALAHDNSDAELVFRGGRVVLGTVLDYPISVTWRNEPRRWHVKKYPRGYLSLGGTLMGANMMMRRAMVDKIGLFDERFGAGSDIPAGEESDYVYRAYAAGVMLEFAPDLLIHHHHGRKTPDEAREVMRNYSIATGAVLAKHFFKDPFTCAPVVWTIKDALIESVTQLNRLRPDIDFSYRNSLACFATGAARFVSAATKPPAAEKAQ
jgi:GT2 family glycosyltransferase